MGKVVEYNKFKKHKEKENTNQEKESMIMENSSNLIINCFIPITERKTVLNQGYKKSIKIASLLDKDTKELSWVWADLASDIEYKNVTSLINQGKDIEYIKEFGKVVSVSLDIEKLGLSELEIQKLENNELVTLHKGFKASAIININDGENIEVPVEDITQEYFTSVAFEKFKDWAKINKIPKEENLPAYFFKHAKYSFELGGNGLVSLEIDGKSII